MANYNKVIVMGNLAREVSVRQTKSGDDVAEFCVAINERGKDGSEKTIFVDVVAFGKLATNIIKYCAKGSAVLVDGRLAQETWQGKDGSNRSKILIIAFDCRFLSKKSEQTQEEARATAKTQGKFSYAEDDEEVPF